MCVYVYVYMDIYACVCVCVNLSVYVWEEPCVLPTLQPLPFVCGVFPAAGILCRGPDGGSSCVGYRQGGLLP